MAHNIVKVAIIRILNGAGAEVGLLAQIGPAVRGGQPNLARGNVMGHGRRQE